jgi:hypothetical protein
MYIQYQQEVDLQKEAEAQDKVYRKKAETQIVDEINKKASTTISAHTVRDFVAKGKAGATPRKGRTGFIKLYCYKALLGTIESFVKLGQQEGK